MAQDSSLPDFWDTRYLNDVMPWDAGNVPVEFADFVRARPQSERVLVPGCGTAYEVGWLAQHGADVLAIDFSPAAIERARAELGPYADRVELADFFALDAGPFDWIYERAFLCALPRKMWADWGRKMAELVRPGGELAGYFFIADTPKGPPFGCSEMELDTLLGPAFVRVIDQPTATTLPVFAGKERWQVWRRR